MTTIINLTPHDVKIRLNNGTDLVLPKSGQEARVAVRQTDRPALLTSDGKELLVVANEYGEIAGLPTPQVDTVYIVSIVVLGLVKGRNDCFAPDTSPQGALRSPDGKIEAVKRLVAAS